MWPCFELLPSSLTSPSPFLFLFVFFFKILRSAHTFHQRTRSSPASPQLRSSPWHGPFAVGSPRIDRDQARGRPTTVAMAHAFERLRRCISFGRTKRHVPLRGPTRRPRACARALRDALLQCRSSRRSFAGQVPLHSSMCTYSYQATRQPKSVCACVRV